MKVTHPKFGAGEAYSESGDTFTKRNGNGDPVLDNGKNTRVCLVEFDNDTESSRLMIMSHLKGVK